MLVSEAFRRFIVSKTAAGCAESTLDWYWRRVGRFVEYLGRRPVSEVGAYDVRLFLVELRGQVKLWAGHPYRPSVPGGLSSNTVRGYARAIRQFARFVASEGLGSDFMEGVRLPFEFKGSGRAVTYPDFLRLVSACDGSSMPERDRAILFFLADTGCRVGGLCGLKVGDLDLSRCEAEVLEKGRKRRIVFFSEVTRGVLEGWLAVRAVSWVCSSVFVSSRGGPLSASGVYQVLRRLAARAGVEGPCNPHAFRHAFARWYLQDGGDLASLSAILGHESVETTKGYYAHYGRAALQRAHGQYSRLALLGKTTG